MLQRFFSGVEARRLCALGGPIFIAQLSQVGMTFVDTIMTGRYNTESMAAVAVAGSIWVPLSLLAAGSLFSLPPMTAQLVGAGRWRETAHLLRQGIWLTLCISVLFIGIFQVLSRQLDVFGLDAATAELSGAYLRAVLWGLPGFMLYVNVRSFLEGYSRTRPDMIIGVLGLTLNIPCNYILIYGKFGLPALGAVGCGISTTFCYWVMALCMAFYVRRAPQYRDLQPLFLPIGRKRPSVIPAFPLVDRALMLRILRIGLPNALALFCEVSLFSVTALLLAPLGISVVAGHQVAINVSSMLFMVPLSLSITTAIRIGHSLGGKDPARARAVGRTALTMSVLFALIFAVIIVLFRHDIVRQYNTDPAVVALAGHLLIYAVAYQVVDGLQAVGLGILRGYNDTRIIFLVCLPAYWGIGLPTGFILARTDWIVPAMGAQGFWIGYLLALGFGACCYLTRVRRLFALDDAAVQVKIRR